MGITLNNAALLLQAKQAGAKFDRILTIGRLRLYISPKALQCLANQHGVEFDRRLWSEGDYAETFFKVFLGSSEVDSLDYNQEKWSIVVYLSRFDQAAIFSMLSCTPSLNTTPSMT
jgi:hypothetical protein